MTIELSLVLIKFNITSTRLYIHGFILIFLLVHFIDSQRYLPPLSLHIMRLIIGHGLSVATAIESVVIDGDAHQHTGMAS